MPKSNMEAVGTKCCGKCRQPYAVVGGQGAKPWQSLPSIGLQLFDHGEAFELRNCPCGSTMGWPVDYAAACTERVAYLPLDVELSEAA